MGEMVMEPHFQPVVAESLKRWHEMLSRGDLQDVSSLLHPDAVFRSPMAHRAYQSDTAVALILRTVVGVFQDFAYERQFASADGLSAVLEFRARVQDRELKGVDLIRFDSAGRIIEFEVMIRPFSGLQALGQEMGKRLGTVLPQYQPQDRPDTGR
jgi:2,4-dienoyl-CoA reductase (NADPH2)